MTVQKAAVWSGPAFLVLYLVAFMGIAEFVPPPSPALSAHEVATLFDENRFAIRVGMVLSLVFSTLLFPFFAVISAHIARIEREARIERGLPILALIQFGGATLLVVYFQLCSMLWIVATFREELSEESVQMLFDFGWLTFVMVFPAYVFQLGCVAIASFLDRSKDPVWPRWAGYLNLWIALSGAGGGLAVFFKTGPFAWNGAVGFFLPVTAFVAWLFVMAHLMLRHAARSEADERSLVKAV
ncbi:hypothetical protein F0U44_06220 [Nocardioides humilatus]|uniref:DUF4386 domain-containing protein n=1 Tax=Nocardioides humilatus TaxID=2607660 RepID=A0A5B1LMF3_9ACTN|nr:hypothetical protein [Nocardioides humilatus]KAA1421861.1 hypothetical protein F0U44_06220 [Nocardioides humilatus]